MATGLSTYSSLMAGLLAGLAFYYLRQRRQVSLSQRRVLLLKGLVFGIPQDNACVNVIDFKVADGAVLVVATNITPDPSHGPSST